MHMRWKNLTMQSDNSVPQSLTGGGGKSLFYFIYFNLMMRQNRTRVVCNVDAKKGLHMCSLFICIFANRIPFCMLRINKYSIAVIAVGSQLVTDLSTSRRKNEENAERQQMCNLGNQSSNRSSNSATKNVGYAGKQASKQASPSRSHGNHVHTMTSRRSRRRVTPILYKPKRKNGKKNDQKNSSKSREKAGSR